MTDYKRRFSKEDFQKELFAHLRDMPRGHLQSPAKLEENARVKAEHYARALEALDAAAERIRKLAAAHPEEQARTEADFALKEIDDAINAYGEAAMSGNSTWGEPFDKES